MDRVRTSAEIDADYKKRVPKFPDFVAIRMKRKVLMVWPCRHCFIHSTISMLLILCMKTAHYCTMHCVHNLDISLCTIPFIVLCRKSNNWLKRIVLCSLYCAENRSFAIVELRLVLCSLYCAENSFLPFE